MTQADSQSFPFNLPPLHSLYRQIKYTWNTKINVHESGFTLLSLNRQYIERRYQNLVLIYSRSRSIWICYKCCLKHILHACFILSTVSKCSAQKALGLLDGHILWQISKIGLNLTHVVTTFPLPLFPSDLFIYISLFSAKALYKATTSSVQHQTGSCNSHKVPTPAAIWPAGLHPFPLSRNSLGICMPTDFI